MKKRLRLIHAREPEALECLGQLRALGFEADWAPLDAALLRLIKSDPPAAVIIDLTRQPAHGRDVGVNLRIAKPTRHVPLIFVGGVEEKVEPVRKLLPDAFYTTWQEIAETLPRALASPPANPVIPESVLAGYSGTPLPKKLGIKAGFTVALVNAPEAFDATLGALPESARLRWSNRGQRDLTLWFVTAKSELERKIERMAEVIGDSGLWIVWPKKASGMKTDVTQTLVRGVGLNAGLVDHKICAVDETWSGLRFVRRR